MEKQEKEIETKAVCCFHRKGHIFDISGVLQPFLSASCQLHGRRNACGEDQTGKQDSH